MDILTEMGIVDAFNVHMTCAGVCSANECVQVLRHVVPGQDDAQLLDLAKAVAYPIGIKKLLLIVETARTYDPALPDSAFRRACNMFGCHNPEWIF